MSSLPGCPSILSVCIHAGWTMGTVNDVYMWYLSSGVQDMCRGTCSTSVQAVGFNRPVGMEISQLQI